MEVLLILLFAFTTIISIWIISFVIFISLEIFYQKQEQENIDKVQYVCPKCGSKAIVYLTLLHHFEIQKDGTKVPVYSSSARCNNCFFKTKSYIDDTENNVLKELRRIKNED